MFISKMSLWNDIHQKKEGRERECVFDAIIRAHNCLIYWGSDVEVINMINIDDYVSCSYLTEIMPLNNQCEGSIPKWVRLPGNELTIFIKPVMFIPSSESLTATLKGFSINIVGLRKNIKILTLNVVDDYFDHHDYFDRAQTPIFQVRWQRQRDQPPYLLLCDVSRG